MSSLKRLTEGDRTGGGVRILKIFKNQGVQTKFKSVCDADRWILLCLGRARLAVPALLPVYELS